MRTAELANTKPIVIKVSEIEFQAALAAYQEIVQSEIPGACDEDDSVAAARAYWNLGNTDCKAKVVTTRKTTIMSRVKSFFA